MSDRDRPAALRLADHFSRLKFGDVPHEQVTQIKHLVLDYFGVAFSGSRTRTGTLIGDFAVALGGPPEASIIGRPERVSAVNAAFANAVSEHSIEMDDVDDEALFHYGPPVVSAALAVAQACNATGEESIVAILAGCEMLSRLSRSCNPSLRDRGFHTTPTCGVFGAAVAAARLLRLGPTQMASALGLAGAQASGLMEMYGPSMQKRFNVGPAARNGVTAAMLARAGFTGADTIIEGENGFGRAFSDGFEVERLLMDLGGGIPVVVEFKAYAAARPIHNAIDCVLQLRERYGVRPTEIESIVVRRHPIWASYHQKKHPQNYHEAQVSLPYSVAVAFQDGAALPRQYADDRVKDPSVNQLAELVQIVADATLPRGVSCRILVTTRAGARHEIQVDYPRGSLQDPLSQDALVEKFDSLASAVLSTERRDNLRRQVLALDEVGDVNRLMDLA